MSGDREPEADVRRSVLLVSHRVEGSVEIEERSEDGFVKEPCPCDVLRVKRDSELVSSTPQNSSCLQFDYGCSVQWSMFSVSVSTSETHWAFKVILHKILSGGI